MWNDYAAVLGLIGTFLGLLTLTIGSFRRHWNSTAVARNPFTYYVLIANLLVTTALPISLALEFGLSRDVGVYKSLGFCSKYYPHLVVYPALLFGFAGLFVFRAAALSWTFAKRGVIIRIAIAMAGTFFAMCYEATGGYLMLFEFNKEVQTASKQFSLQETKERADALGIGAALVTPMAIQVSEALKASDGTSAIATALKTYEAWESLDEDWRSKSRPVYLALFWYILFIMLLGFALIPTGLANSQSRRRFDSMISLNLVGSLLVFLMWTPFRIYYNVNTKIPIFGKNIVDNFFGRLPIFNIGGIMPSDAGPIVAISVFIYFLLLRAADLSKKAAVVVVAVSSLFIVVLSACLASTQPETFDAIYGLDGDVKFLCFRVVVLFLILLLTYDFLASRVD